MSATLAARLVEARKALNMTQEAFCEASGLPLSTLKKYEGSHREPGASQLALIAKAGVDIAWLVSGGEMMIAEVKTTPGAGHSRALSFSDSEVPYRAGAVDSLLLEDVVSLFYDFLDRHKDSVRLDRSRHAAVIAVLYKIAAASGKADKTELEQVLRAAA